MIQVLILFSLFILFAHPPSLLAQQPKHKKPVPRSAPPALGVPIVHPDDPADPWTCEELKSVEIEVGAGQLEQIADFKIPQKAREALIEGKVTQSIRSVDIFVVSSKETEQLKLDREYEPKEKESIGGALAFFFPVKAGTQYSVWVRNQTSDQVARIKLSLIRHFR